MLIDAHLKKQTTKSHSVSPPSVFNLFSLSRLLTLFLSVLCMSSDGFVTVCVYFGDRLGLICTTAVEGKGWHVNTVIWHCTHWG